MFNIIGKGLVLVNTLLCLAGLLLATLVYFEFVDWGRSEPRVVHGEPTKSGSNDQRIASEYDRSKVLFDDAVLGRNLVIPPIAPAEDSLREVASRYGPNHLFYVAELNKLRTGDNPIEVKAITADGIPTDTPGKAIGKPIPEIKIDGLDKSLEKYAAELKTEMAKLDALEAAIGKLADADQEISYELTGKDKDGKKKTHGLFQLIDQEFQTQQRNKEEREYLQPFHATTVEEARRFAMRRTSLEATLAGLEKALKARQPK
jgi:hypothetical protein